MTFRGKFFRAAITFAVAFAAAHSVQILHSQRTSRYAEGSREDALFRVPVLTSPPSDGPTKADQPLDIKPVSVADD